MKFNGNEREKMCLRKKAHTHKYEMEMYSLCSTTVEKYTGVTAGHGQTLATRVMVYLHGSRPGCVSWSGWRRITQQTVLTVQTDRKCGEDHENVGTCLGRVTWRRSSCHTVTYKASQRNTSQEGWLAFQTETASLQCILRRSGGNANIPADRW